MPQSGDPHFPRPGAWAVRRLTPRNRSSVEIRGRQTVAPGLGVRLRAVPPTCCAAPTSWFPSRSIPRGNGHGDSIRPARSRGIWMCGWPSPFAGHAKQRSRRTCLRHDVTATFAARSSYGGRSTWTALWWFSLTTCVRQARRCRPAPPRCSLPERARSARSSWREPRRDSRDHVRRDRVLLALPIEPQPSALRCLSPVARRGRETGGRDRARIGRDRRPCVVRRSPARCRAES